MGKYSIHELEQLSGIKAHTIRIWEKRYSIISPARTVTNIRFYSDDDLKKILNVSMLNNNGIKISKLAELSDDELAKKVLELSTISIESEVHIDQLITAMIDLEEESFERVLSTISSKIGFEEVVITVLYPFLRKIGILWHTNNVNPAQEHFITHLIRQKMIVAIDQLPVPSKKNRRAILFLPENELHEIGLLFYNFIARKNGLRTYYLGQTVPYKDVKSVCEIHKPAVIITTITSSPQAENLQEFLNTLCQDQSKTKILVSGHMLSKVKVELPPNLHLFTDAQALKQLIKSP